MERSKTSWNFVSRLLIIGLVAVFTALVLVLGFGLVQGEQISPQDFRMRSYSYYRIPGIQLQITPVKYTAIQNLLTRQLRDAGYLRTQSAIEQWDEVSYQAVGRGPARGRAWVLAAQLSIQDAEGGYRWLDWTEAHPEQAKSVWPQVAQAARDGVYFVIPDLLRAAEAHTTLDADLEEELLQLMRVAYQQQIEASREQQEMDRVTELGAALEALSANSQANS